MAEYKMIMIRNNLEQITPCFIFPDKVIDLEGNIREARVHDYDGTRRYAVKLGVERFVFLSREVVELTELERGIIEALREDDKAH